LKELLERCEISVEGSDRESEGEEQEGEEVGGEEGETGLVVDINDLLTVEEPPGIPCFSLSPLCFRVPCVCVCVSVCVCASDTFDTYTICIFTHTYIHTHTHTHTGRGCIHARAHTHIQTYTHVRRAWLRAPWILEILSHVIRARASLLLQARLLNRQLCGHLTQIK
jgi:hypothetical protein